MQQPKDISVSTTSNATTNHSTNTNTNIANIRCVVEVTDLRSNSHNNSIENATPVEISDDVVDSDIDIDDVIMDPTAAGKLNEYFLRR